MCVKCFVQCLDIVNAWWALGPLILSPTPWPSTNLKFVQCRCQPEPSLFLLLLKFGGGRVSQSLWLEKLSALPRIAVTSWGTWGLWSPPSHFESTWLENSDFIFADFQERRWWWWVHAVRLATWCWLPAPLPVTHPLAFLESPNCFSLCAAEGHLSESRQELPLMEHFLGARICSKHFAESPHVNLWVCAFTVPAVGEKLGDTFDQAIWPRAQSSTIHSTAWLFRNLSSRLWGLNWYLREITNKSFPNNRDPPYKEPLR